MESWDLPITHNALLTREDLAAALGQILEPLRGALVRGGSGLHVGNSSALFDESVALLEGYSRLFWGLAPLAAGGGTSPMIAPMLEGLAAGTDPSGPHYWGVGGDRDQRYVEMAAISLALLIAPGTFWEPLPEAARRNLASWLGTINGVELPPTNWEFFRVLVNVALMRLERPHDPGRLEAGLALIEGLYRGDGWYVDETNYDLYNPFGFHFYGLAYSALMGHSDPGRCERYRERARLFARQYLPWQCADGSAIPHGRSLGYRFAAAAFFSACAFAGEEVLPWGELKGVVMRNLRWWLARPIFDRAGVLTIGYGYPNLVMAEQYNSPGSPYWSLKAFLVLALPEGHPFWRAEEAPLAPQPAVSLNAPPNILICRDGEGEAEHAYALAAGQYPCWESLHSAAKYAKFAYSSRFGFCVSHGSYDLPKTGCDGMLLFSEGDGYWRERRHTRERFSCAEYLRSTWSPWPDVEVTSWLIPFGPWHVRAHAIRSGRALDTVEGGFSLPDQNALEPAPRPRVELGPGSILAVLPWAAGGIFDLGPLSRGLGGLVARAEAGSRRGAELHKPEPNLNLLYPKVFVPILRGRVEKGDSLLACAVYAVAGAGRGSGETPPEGWADKPELSVDTSGIVVARRGSRLVEIGRP